MVLCGIAHLPVERVFVFIPHVNAQHKTLKTFAVLVYGHVYIICSYYERKIKILIF